MWQIKYIYLHLQETSGHQTRQDTVFLWEAPTLKVIRLFDDLTKVTLRDSFRNLHFRILKTWLLNLGANLQEEVQYANA